MLQQSKEPVYENILAFGVRLSAAEAERMGLVSKVVPQDQLLPEAHRMAAKIGELSALAVAKAKDCIHRAYETTLSEGLQYEQCAFLLIDHMHVIISQGDCPGLSATMPFALMMRKQVGVAWPAPAHAAIHSHEAFARGPAIAAGVHEVTMSEGPRCVGKDSGWCVIGGSKNGIAIGNRDL